MRTAEKTPAAEARAAIARHNNVRIYKVAARLDLHPASLSLLLNDHRSMSQDFAERLMRAIEAEAAAK